MPAPSARALSHKTPSVLAADAEGDVYVSRFSVGVGHVGAVRELLLHAPYAASGKPGSGLISVTNARMAEDAQVFCVTTTTPQPM